MSSRLALREIVVPHIGHVQFHEPRSRAKVRLRGILTATTAIGMGAFLFFFWLSKDTAPTGAQWVGDHFVLFIGLIWGSALVVVAWLVTFPRLYAYGALVFGSLVITDLVPGIPLGLLADSCWRRDPIDRHRPTEPIPSPLSEARNGGARGVIR